MKIWFIQVVYIYFSFENHLYIRILVKFICTREKIADEGSNSHGRDSN